MKNTIQSINRMLANVAWIALTVCATVCTTASAQAANEAALAGFGGSEGLAKMTNDFVERLQKNERIARFFADSDNERLAALLTEQFCDLLGGGCKYSGRPMGKVHRGMNVKSADFNALAEELQNAMNAAGVSQSEQYRLIAKLAPMHRDVVEK
jgi:hemoglobin